MLLSGVGYMQGTGVAGLMRDTRHPEAFHPKPVVDFALQSQIRGIRYAKRSWEERWIARNLPMTPRR